MSILMAIISWVIVISVGLGWLIALISPFIVSMFSVVAAPPLLTFRLPIIRKAVIGSEFKALLIDDQPSSLIVLEYIFKGVGIDYKVVKSGMEAIREMNRTVYNLVVIDYDMPVMSGAETLAIADRYLNKRKKESKLVEYNAVPVIGFATNQGVFANLPNMKRFCVQNTYKKDSNYAYLKREFGRYLPTLSSAS